MLLKLAYIALALRFVCGCATIQAQTVSQFESALAATSDHDNDSVLFLVRYTAWTRGHKYRIHPPSTMYFVLNNYSEAAKAVFNIDSLGKDDLSIIPMYMTIDKIGYIWGGQAFAPNILGCCVYGDIRKAVKQYVIEHRTDSLIEKYETISLLNEDILKSINYREPNVKLCNRHIVVEMYLTKIKANHIICKSCGFENISYTTSNRLISYLTDTQHIQELSPEEIIYWEYLFSHLLTPIPHSGVRARP